MKIQIILFLCSIDLKYLYILKDKYEKNGN